MSFHIATLLKIEALFPDPNADARQITNGHRSPRQIFVVPDNMLTFSWVKRFGASLENSEDLLTPWPTFPSGANSRMLKGTLSQVPRPAQTPAQGSSPAGAPSPVPDGAGPTTLLPRIPKVLETCYKFWLLGPRTQWVFPREANGGSGDILSAFIKEPPGWVEGDKAPGIPSSREIQVLSIPSSDGHRQTWKGSEQFPDTALGH